MKKNEERVLAHTSAPEPNPGVCQNVQNEGKKGFVRGSEGGA